MKPYAKAQTFRLGERFDRRCKLTDADRMRIRELYAQGDIGTRPLARMFHVSRSLVRLIVNPESARKNSARIKANWKNTGKGGVRNNTHVTCEIIETTSIPIRSSARAQERSMISSPRWDLRDARRA